MRIYYFGELIEDTNNPEFKIQNEAKEIQMALNFDEVTIEADQIMDAPQHKNGMPSVGALLKDIDLSIDVHRPEIMERFLKNTNNVLIRT